MNAIMEMDRERLFCGTELAARIEHGESELIAAAGDAALRRAPAADGFVMPIAGGVACFAEPESPFNKVAGTGFDGTPNVNDLEAVEAAFADRGANVQVELANLADPEFAGLLTERGYRLTSYENVLGMAIPGDARAAMPHGVEVRRSGDDEFDAWLDVVADGFAHPDRQGVPSHEEFPRDVLERAERDFAAAGIVRYVALRNGVVAGGASFRIAGRIAQLAGAATAPAHRRHGVQTALLAARLRDAAAAGCEIAVVTTQPGSKSQENVQRRGFDLLYTRAVLVKEP
jgi:GNAT superfamily N-acetyltransferase